jgi:hypothetical protein
MFQLPTAMAAKRIAILARRAATHVTAHTPACDAAGIVAMLRTIELDAARLANADDGDARPAYDRSALPLAIRAAGSGKVLPFRRPG